MDYLNHTLWLIWSNEHKGWWKANHNGYTQDLTEAGVYRYQEAANIVYGANIALLHDNKAIPNEAMILLEAELKDKFKERLLQGLKRDKNIVWFQQYRIVKRRPVWATINFDGEVIKEEEYTHQDQNFSNMCLSQYCRCRD